ncbi:MAG: UvrD-helicase domain-containing protein, partial [Solirubrobacterales bacterium]|nr:UvrD-helicase domain-containing protein [Solirubrobacterales bacterium]
ALRNAGVDSQRWQLTNSWSGRPAAYAEVLRSYLVNYQLLKRARGGPVADSHDILDAVLTSECEVDLLLVDEAQDLTRIQLEACCHLARNGELVLVGDDAQRIYGFRHAGSSPLAALPQGASLVVNHRSACSIVTVANALAVPGRLTQQHHRQAVGTVRRGVLPTDDDDKLARAIALLVAEEQSSACAPATTAVLCRTNDEVRRVVKAARALSLPVRWNARRYLGKSIAVAALLDYAQDLMGPAVVPASVAPVLAQLAGLEGGAVAALGTYETLDVALCEANGNAGFGAGFLRRHEELSEMSPGVPLGRRLRAIVENLDLVTQLMQRQTDGIEADALLALLEVVEQEREHLTLDELRRLTQSGDAGGPEPDPRWRTKGIVILTVHDAKGLEWESVLLPYFLRRAGRPPGPVLVEPQSSTTVSVGVADLALDDGSNKVASRSDREAAEADGRPLKRLRDPVYSEILSDVWARERAEGLRLDYVAVTRARDRLTVVAADPRGRWPLELSHLHTAIAEAEQRHPDAVTRLTSPLTPRPPSARTASHVPAVRLAVEQPRPLVSPPLSPTRLERLLDGR